MSAYDTAPVGDLDWDYMDQGDIETMICSPWVGAALTEFFAAAREHEAFMAGRRAEVLRMIFEALDRKDAEDAARAEFLRDRPHRVVSVVETY